MKSISFFMFFFCALTYSSCSPPKLGGPVEEPADILSNFMSFSYYWNDNVKLSLDFISYDENDSLISKGDFLKELSSGEYLPLRLQPDSIYIYKLYKMTNLSDKDISNMIVSYGKRHYQYFQMEGKPLPGFNFVDLNGNLYNEENCKGKIVVLKSWFIRCQACVAEIPALNQLVNSYKNRHDILFVSLALDSPQKLRDFLAKARFNYAVVPNMQHYLIDTLKTIFFPTHFIIDKKGLVVNVTNDYHQMEVVLGKEALR